MAQFYFFLRFSAYFLLFSPFFVKFFVEFFHFAQPVRRCARTPPSEGGGCRTVSHTMHQWILEFLLECLISACVAR